MTGSKRGTGAGRGRAASGRPDRLDRRALAWGLAASLALHAVAFLAVRGGPVVTDGGAAAGPPSPDPAIPRDALHAVHLAVRLDEIRPPPRPRLDVAEPVVVTRAVPSTPLASAPVAVGKPPSAGDRAGPNGTGSAGEGASEGMTPPVPRSLFPEWEPPASVRGMEVTVRVRVDARGRPTGEVELVPPTPDRAFNRRLAEKARRMEYRPARKDGVPVVGWAEITFVF